ncbi:TonB-dependent hemoglobin/transferrin/lactoferrin family receptor [Rhodoferax aquaticus]|uniref:TonB-dependent hemoglobin/transferrin/lactoferrin family receptor n=1 Tax=Rhodoferax aquaticus TaxID=2527691 RepID=A0A515ENF8_9BURK|nr:TonB-dependent hemoglobin/transferrin/lactoferrin family receptor [Rhodoferax aquaticus]QDL54195.1 TonB-dependent hemoglobin/transferrin/lactoferrin family receptor [Rhodoferax aquaticus]
MLDVMVSGGSASGRAALVLGLACAGHAAIAQETGVAQAAKASVHAHVPALKEVVVSGSRSEQDKDELPITMEVKDRKAIEAEQIRDIRDVARDMPNVSVKRSPTRNTLAQVAEGRDGNAGFNVRGLDGNRVLLLVDGMRTPLSYTFGGNSFGRDYFDLGLVERVELVKGPAASLYGSDGLAGVVNMITREPASMLKDGASFGGTASLGYSSDDAGTTAGVALAGKATDTVQWLVAANVNNASAMSNMGRNDVANGDRTVPNPQTDKTESVMGKLVFQPRAGSKHSITAEHVAKRSDVDVMTARAKPPILASTVIGLKTAITQQRDRLTFESRERVDTAFADSVQGALSYQASKSQDYSYEDRNTTADRIRDLSYEEKAWQFGLRAEKLLPQVGVGSHKLSYGVDGVSTQIESMLTGVTPAPGDSLPVKRFPDTRESSSAVYVHDEWLVGDWTITPGIRFDSYSLKAEQAGFQSTATSLSGNAVSPKLGALYRANADWSMYGSYAAGFKAPNAFQVNNFFENALQGYKTIPNPDLKPERSQNFELGLRGRLGHVDLDVAVFESRYTDLIEDRKQVSATGVTPRVFQSVNINRAQISGFEIKGNWMLGTVGSGIVSTQWAYGQSRGTNSDTGAPINSIDPAKLNLGLKYSSAAWDARLSATHYAAKSASDVDNTDPGVAANQFVTPEAVTLDLSGQWRVRKGLRLNAAINNLTDQKVWRWSDVRGLDKSASFVDLYTQSGRNAQVTVVAEF